ncbi:MAG: hypothetical protein N4A37_11785 [Prolixibacteraceae bacterium]|jgi:hypothetical protein|nr:hypothetical protein [Prolixibacteraceae bacterium]
MKNKLFYYLLFLCCSFLGDSAYGQLFSSKVCDGQYVWQKVYKSAYNLDDTKELLICRNRFNDIHLFDRRLSAIANDVVFHDWKYLGINPYSDISYHQYVTSFKVFVEFKDHQYRVTVSHMLLKSIGDVEVDDGIFVKQEDPIESWILNFKRTDFNKDFYKEGAIIIEHTMDDLFTLPEKSSLFL